MTDLNKDVSFEEFNMIQKNNKFANLQQNVKDQIYSKLKYILIRRIPILFFIFLFITLFLIYYSSNKLHNESYKLKIDKLCYLVMGITIIISNVYLSSLRTEYKDKMYSMFKYKNEIDNFNEYKLNQAIYNSQSFDVINYI